MSGRIRPSARKKTLYNVKCSQLSETDKKCIEEVFGKFEQQKTEIEALTEKLNGAIAGQETLQKALAEKDEEFENQSQNFKVLISDHMTLQHDFDNLKGLYEAEKAKVEKAKEKSTIGTKAVILAKKHISKQKINSKRNGFQTGV